MASDADPGCRNSTEANRSPDGRDPAFREANRAARQAGSVADP